jgi:hypothetical protein
MSLIFIGTFKDVKFWIIAYIYATILVAGTPLSQTTATTQSKGIAEAPNKLNLKGQVEVYLSVD